MAVDNAAPKQLQQLHWREPLAVDWLLQGSCNSNMAESRWLGITLALQFKQYGRNPQAVDYFAQPVASAWNEPLAGYYIAPVVAQPAWK